ncbi:hypothetical protein [Microbacterium enclense]|uniref:hypothetical protein n=1 Tax=Microbacterium enclense TaxID=993073 RepID=UPI00343E5DF0
MSVSILSSPGSRVRFGDVVTNINDYFSAGADGVLPYVAGPHIVPGHPSVATYGSTADDDFPPTFKRKFQSGDVLLHSRGVDKLASVDRRGVTGEKLFVLRSTDEARLRQRFLLWLLMSAPAKQHIRRHFTGSVNRFLNWGPLADFEFDLPTPDEQDRISDLFWTIEQHRVSLTCLADALATAADVQLAQMWDRNGNKQSIASIADCVTGSTPSKANAEYWNSQDVPFYTPSEIEGDTVRPARQQVSRAGAAAGRALPKYAVAVACIGGDMGKSAVVPEPGISNQQITAIVGLLEADAYAMQALLAHARGRQAMEARETTTIVRKLNKSDLMKVEVPWPVDRAPLQRLVANRRRATAELRAEVDALRQLRLAMLANLLGGD